MLSSATGYRKGRGGLMLNDDAEGVVKPEDAALDTQVAAPPAIPPRRPLVAAGLPDNDDLTWRLQEQARQLHALKDQLLAALAARKLWRSMMDGYSS
jgi:hypothetical protein